MTAARRRTTTALAVVVVGVLAALPLLVAPPAQASTYRYWTYWWAASNTQQGASGWRFSSVGPAGHRANDTWVLGWRFSTTTSTTGGTKPRASSDFAALCPGLAPAAGKDRVAVVLDYGTTSDAPPGQTPPSTTSARVECLSLPSHPTGLAVLNAAQIPIRSKDGLVCALDQYPQGECAPLVADPSPTPTAKATPTPGRTSAAPVVPQTGRSSSAAPGSTTASSSTPAAATASGAPATPTSQPGATASGPAPSDEPTLQAASGAPTGDTSSKAGPGNPVATVLGTAAVVALAGAAFWISRRRS